MAPPVIAPDNATRNAAYIEAQHTAEPTADSTARWLGGAGIVAGVVAIGMALVMRRRS